MRCFDIPPYLFFFLSCIFALPFPSRSAVRSRFLWRIQSKGARVFPSLTPLCPAVLGAFDTKKMRIIYMNIERQHIPEEKRGRGGGMMICYIFFKLAMETPFSNGELVYTFHPSRVLFAFPTKKMVRPPPWSIFIYISRIETWMTIKLFFSSPSEKALNIFVLFPLQIL